MSDPFSVKKILCPTDFSQPSQKAVSYAASIAKAFGAELFLLNVIEPVFSNTFVVYEPTLGSQLQISMEEHAQEHLAKLEEQLSEAGHKVESKITQGRSYSEIIEEANNIGADMIVLGTHGRTGIGHFLIGSTAEKVVRMAKCPVVTVKADVEEENDG